MRSARHTPRGARLVTVLLLLAAAASTTEAQYFGQNKVNYRKFEFAVLKTEHFDVYYYPEERETAEHVSRMSERWYARLTKIFSHQLRGRQPLILYASAPHFQQTNTILGGIGEGTGGVTEALRRRIVLPSAGPLAETDHVVGHELIHAFQFDMSTSNKGAALPAALRLPLWFMEGMAEYLSVGPVDPQTAMWMRDALRGEKLPALKDLNNPKYFPYRWGQAFWAYVGGRWGDAAVAQMMKNAGRDADITRALKEVLETTPEQVSKDWHEALRTAYAPFMESRKAASTYGKAILTEKNAGDLNLAPALSPDGKKLVFLSERDQFSIDFFLADAENGTILKKLYSNVTDPHLDSLQFIQSAGDWNPAGDRFAFAGLEEGHGLLAILDIERGEIVRKVPLPEIDQVFDPSWSPDGRSVVFSGQRGGLLDLYVYDLEAGAAKRLTTDAFADLQPDWSPDGKRIAFVTDRFSTKLDDLSYGNYRLALIDPQTGAIDPVPSLPSARHSDPQWSSDGKGLVFLCDANGASNVWRVELPGGTPQQLTDLVTGVSGITALSPALSVAGDSMVAAIREDGKFRIYRIDGKDGLSAPEGEKPMADLLPPFQRKQQDVLALNEDSLTGLPSPELPPPAPYKPKLELEFAGSPTLEVGTSRFGTYIGGSTALSFSDLLGNHRLDTVFSVNGRIRDIGAQAIYTNLASRWNWGGGGQRVPYITGRQVFEQLDVSSGTPLLIQDVLSLRQTETGAFGFAQYPFNRAFRFEVVAGFSHIQFSADVESAVYTYPDGRLVDVQERSESLGDPLNLATTTAALVYDTSVFGATSPILGRRFRVGVTPTTGTVSYTGVLADLRQYFMPVRPYTFAFRLLHYGRYGGGAEDTRFPLEFLGYPDLTRGYDSGSFDIAECGASPDGGCPVFDQLLGSRVLVGNAELRFPLVGALTRRTAYGPVPLELALFADAGVAWVSGQSPKFLGGERELVKSVGAAARINFLGFAVIEIDYVRPLDRPRKDWIWQFNLSPGF